MLAVLSEQLWAARLPFNLYRELNTQYFTDEIIFTAEILNWSILLEADMDQYKGFKNWGLQPHVGSLDLQNGLMRGTILKWYIWN